MHRPGLYFPYTHIRDEAWLKAAALYWPSIRRLVPFHYRKSDSRTAHVFADAGVLRDVDPLNLLTDTSWTLASALRANAEALKHRYSLRRAKAEWDGERWSSANALDFELPWLGWIHVSKFPVDALAALEEIGIAYVGRHLASRIDRVADGYTRPEDWIGLHPALAGAYMTSMAARVGRRQGMQPLTDQVDLRIATANDNISDALRLLSRSKRGESRSNGAVDTYVTLALQQVHAAGLEDVPAEKIIQCRETLAEELEEFRSYVESKQTELANVVSIPRKEWQLEAFTAHVAETIEMPLRRLEKSLKLLNLEPTRSLLLAGTFAPPLAVQQALEKVNAPPAINAVAAVATGIGSAWWQVEHARNAARAESPVSYLLDVRDHLTPRTLLSRLRRIYKGTYSGRVEGIAPQTPIDDQ